MLAQVKKLGINFMLKLGIKLGKKIRHQVEQKMSIGILCQEIYFFISFKNLNGKSSQMISSNFFSTIINNSLD